MPEATLSLLRKKSLSNAAELEQCTEAAKAVRGAMSAELSPGIKGVLYQALLVLIW